MTDSPHPTTPATTPATGRAPIVLVPGWWLGAWAWDGVADRLRAAGHTVTALTLPGLEPDHPDRGSVSLADQADAIVAALEAQDRPVVLAVHSGASQPGYLASDRVPERIATLVYVDTAPGRGALKPDAEGPELPLPATWEELGENLDGIPDDLLAAFRARAVPEPTGPVRDAPVLANDARLDVRSVVIATAFSAADYRSAAAEGAPWLAGLTELRDVGYVDLPTSHWPMWSRPDDLAELLGRAADGVLSGTD